MEQEDVSDLSAVVRLLSRMRADSSIEINVKTRLLEDLGLDSLALIYLVEEIQRVLKVEFLPEDYSLENMHSVASILKLVSRRRDGANRSE
jgi:acyl carrier protein